MELYAGSYGHRYSDTLDALVGLSAEAVQTAVDEAVEYELRYLADSCMHDGPSSGCTADGYCAECDSDSCSLCNAEIVTYGIWPIYRVSDLGGLRKTIDIVRDLRDTQYPRDVVSIGV